MDKLLFIEDILGIFDEVQKRQIFPDQKLMADVIPLFSVEEIKEKYAQQKDNIDFDLKLFVSQNFKFDEPVEIKLSEGKLSIEEHIDSLWDKLEKENRYDKGTLISLPKSYIVPGGRFNEFFYWDSYFVMLGLQACGRVRQMKNILDNCASLIKRFGFIPNGNRSYFLTRSQPPYFSLMVKLYAETVNEEEIIGEYIEALEAEYKFWMDEDNSENIRAVKKTVKIKDNKVLNRYSDASNDARFESYLIDLKAQKESANPEFMRDIRSACESGWDFSSRWFSDLQDIKNIETQNILPVDLNCLLWNLENTLAEFYKNRNEEKAEFFSKKACERHTNIDEFFWNKEKNIYSDYNWEKQKYTDSEHIACVFPLSFNLASQQQALFVEKALAEKFLKEGGLLTTTVESGQQWDAPNGWAPLQWMAFIGMKNYEHHDTADKIKNNWCENVERVYQNTGKLMEKYNVLDIDSKAGGGEYPNQDGFGWTNGVYIKMKKMN